MHRLLKSRAATAADTNRSTGVRSAAGVKRAQLRTLHLFNSAMPRVVVGQQLGDHCAVLPLGIWHVGDGLRTPAMAQRCRKQLRITRSETGGVGGTRDVPSLKAGGHKQFMDIRSYPRLSSPFSSDESFVLADRRPLDRCRCGREVLIEDHFGARRRGCRLLA